MGISVRSIRYESESQQLVDTLQANLPHLPHALLFPWLYLQNPEGLARVWVATDSQTDRIVGVAAAFPRRVYCRGQEVRSHVLGDFCIDPAHRSLGLALTLQRTCMDALTSEDAGFAFDFPSPTMLAIYKRLQIEVSATMVRYAKPLRVDRKVAERIPLPFVARGISALANAGLKLRDSSAARSGDLIITVEPGLWGEEFTTATREWSPRTGICVARTAEYLNWRYQKHPQQKYEMLVARKAGALSGYLIHHFTEHECIIDDLLAEDDATRTELLAEGTAVARKRRVHTVSVPWLSSHPGTQLLEQCGFLARESSPVALFSLQRGAPSQVQMEKEQWYLMHGDWES